MNVHIHIVRVVFSILRRYWLAVGNFNEKYSKRKTDVKRKHDNESQHLKTKYSCKAGNYELYYQLRSVRISSDTNSLLFDICSLIKLIT